MQNSCKAVVFETHIPFQLAFYALVEHDTDIAPLWDPQKRAFVAMMTMTDFISALRAYRRNGIPVSELSNSLIADMLENTNFKFRHDTFETVDAEETVYQMCRLLQRQGTDFVPVVDPDEGNLVAILGYLDIVNLLYTASLQFTHLFETTVEESKVGTYQVCLLVFCKCMGSLFLVVLLFYFTLEICTYVLRVPAPPPSFFFFFFVAKHLYSFVV